MKLIVDELIQKDTKNCVDVYNRQYVWVLERQIGKKVSFLFEKAWYQFQTNSRKEASFRIEEREEQTKIYKAKFRCSFRFEYGRIIFNDLASRTQRKMYVFRRNEQKTEMEERGRIQKGGMGLTKYKCLGSSSFST